MLKYKTLLLTNLLLLFQGNRVPKWPQKVATFVAKLAWSRSAMNGPLLTTAALKSKRKGTTKRVKNPTFQG
jgi:hypothetical protein